LAEEIRCLPNDHEAKLQVLEVRQRKFSLEVFSSFLFHLSPFYFILYLQTG
jgi:lysine-specific demethylase 3